MPNLTSTLAIKLLDGISGPAKGAAASLGAIGKAQAEIGKIDAFRKQSQRLDEMRRAHEKARDNIKGLAAQLLAAEAPSKRMQAAYERATASVEKLGNKIEWQKARVRGAASELERMGVSVNSLASAEARLQANVDRTTAAMRRQEAAAARSQARRAAIGDAATVAGGILAYRGKEIGRKAIVSAADFDIGVRQQRAYAGITEEEQNRLLIPQAKKIGQDTQFSNLDIVKAQTAIMQRLPEQLPRASVAQAITEEVKNYALSMQADMKTSAEGITAFLMQTGKDISTQDKAVTQARRASNMLIRMAKIGGMSDEDVSQFMKYAGTSATLAGLSNETLGALGVGLKRAGFRGDEAGVGIRTISSKLVSPGRKGMDALTAMGVDYNRFTRMPGGLSAENLEAMQKRRFGKTFSADQRARLTEIMEDGEIVSNKDNFIAQVSAVIAESFNRTKGGATLKQDADKITKLAADFHQLGVASVNSEGLLTAILAASPTLQQLNALFTDKQGGKAGALGKAFEQIAKDREALRTTPDDFGRKIADEIMGGLGGSLERLKGSVENFYLALGEANSKVLKLSFDNIGNALDGISNLGTGARQAATAIGALGAGAAGGLAFLRLSKAVMGVGGPSAALVGSAAALDGSAVALTRAAIALGAKGVDLPDASGGKAKGKAGWLNKLGAGGKAVGVLGLAYGGAVVGSSIGSAAKAVGSIAAGEHYVPKDSEEVTGLRAQVESLRSQIAGIRARTHPSRANEPNFDVTRIEGEIAELENRIAEAARQAGTAAGTSAGSGMAEGIRAQRGAVEAEAQSVMQRIMGLFGVGVDVPVRLKPSAMPSSPTSPAIPGASAAPASAPGGSGQTVYNSSLRVNITTGSGDPNEIADRVSRKVAEATQRSMRGSFSDNA